MWIKIADDPHIPLKQGIDGTAGPDTTTICPHAAAAAARCWPDLERLAKPAIMTNIEKWRPDEPIFIVCINFGWYLEKLDDKKEKLLEISNP